MTSKVERRGPDVCGDGYCSASEDYQNCPEDCLCVPDCEGRECGDAGCGGTCPPGCAEAEVCSAEGLCELDCDLDDDGYEGEQCGGPDCDDGNALIHPDAEEVCNGIDDDCDGIVDIPIGPLGEPLRVTNAPYSSRYPRLVWTGSEYALCWEDWRHGAPEIDFARVSESGELLGDEVRVTDTGEYSRFPNLVWNGAEYPVAWQEGSPGSTEVCFARLASDGTVLEDLVRVNSSEGAAEYPSLVYDGENYAVGWQDSRDGNDEIYFVTVGGCF